MKRKDFLIIIATVLMIFTSALCASALDEKDAAVQVTADGDVKYYSSLEKAWDESGEYGSFDVKLLKDVKIDDQLKVGDLVARECTVTVDLNGHKIDAQKKDRVFYVPQILHTVFGGQNELIIDDSAGGGVIENGKANVCGGFAMVGGHLILRGGTIRNCSSTAEMSGTGGAVYLQERGDAFFRAGRFTIEDDAVIEDCVATDGGAVYADQRCTIEIKGGTIRNCHANEFGGAIYCVDKGGTVDMTGGTIENCTCDGPGGGVYLDSGTGMGMKGGVIKGCESANKGGGIYLNTGSWVDATDSTSKVKGPRLTLSGGTITENHAGEYGGGVYLESSGSPLITLPLPTIHVLKDVDVTGNTGPKRADTSCENNIYLDSDDDGDCIITISGEISGKVGVNMDKMRTFAKQGTMVFGDKSEHILSDYRNWIVKRDGRNYVMEMAEPEIKSIELVTKGKDNSKTKYDIDYDKHEAVINVGRELDYSALGYEQLKIEWIGEDFIDTNTDKVLTAHENPMDVSMFGVSGEGAAYDEYYSVASEGKDPVKWHIVLKEKKPITEVNLMVYDTNVYDVESGKQLHGTREEDGPENITVKSGQKLRIEAIVPEGEEFDYWGGHLEDLEDILKHTNPEEFEMPECDIGIEPSFK